MRVCKFESLQVWKHANVIKQKCIKQNENVRQFGKLAYYNNLLCFESSFMRDLFCTKLTVENPESTAPAKDRSLRVISGGADDF